MDCTYIDEDDEDYEDQAYVFTDARYFGAESFVGDGPEEDEESEDDGEEDVNKFDRFIGNMDDHEDGKWCIRQSFVPSAGPSVDQLWR